MSSKKNQKTASKFQLDMRLTLILFAILPMLLSVVIISSILIKTSSSELKQTTHNAMVSIIKDTGNSFDVTTENNERAMLSYMTAPIVKKFLKNPTDPILAAEIQQYTVDYYNSLDGWEGIYLSNWDTVCLAHPLESVIGRQFREDEAYRKELQDAMLASDGVYNTGIITSPATGQLIMSMYAPVYDDDGTPLGYVGAGTFVNNVATKFSDVSSLGLSSAYIYFVDAGGTMLYHPDESKIGNPVENEAVKGLVARLEAGEKDIQPGVVEYKYKGANKYAGYYIGADNAYIAVLTADETDALATVNTVIIVTIVLSVICIIVFAVLAIIIARLVSKPLTQVAKSTEVLSSGDVTVECNAKSVIKETKSIIGAFDSLKNALMGSMSNVKNSASALNMAIVSVDGMTANNVESVTQISQAIDEVATTSQAVAEDAQLMAEKASELGVNVEQLSGNVSTLYDASLVIKNANDDATTCMKSVYAGANESVEAVQDIATKIAETNAAIVEIGSAVQAIESIAAQTNLLSLNASIEAARAGEAGRGFAVVADEIRTLADSSAQSAKEIKQIIENVVDLSNGTVEISNRVYEVISKEQADIQTTQDKFIVLSESVESSIVEIDTIKRMTGKLDEIKTDITNATSNLGAISEQLGASAQEVAASCQSVTEACTDTQASTEEMRAINDSMSTEIDFFKLS